MALCLDDRFLIFVSRELHQVVVESIGLKIIHLICLACLFFGIILHLQLAQLPDKRCLVPKLLEAVWANGDAGSFSLL